MRKMLHFKVFLSYQTTLSNDEFLKFQQFDAHVKKSWYACLDDLFGKKTQNFDGYIKNITLHSTDGEMKDVEFRCYIVFDENKKIEAFREQHGSNWEIELNNLIANKILNAAKCNTEAAEINAIPLEAYSEMLMA